MSRKSKRKHPKTEIRFETQENIHGDREESSKSLCEGSERFSFGPLLLARRVVQGFL